tara:strand:- start:195 stop:710 length:516 start_codon:yes stop_codon:yes gene_type:complete
MFIKKKSSRPSKILVKGNYAEITLCNKFGERVADALISLVDTKTCGFYRWCICNGYVVTAIPNATNQIRLHRYILNAPTGSFVDHINGDKLDNRRENIRVCTIAENNVNRRIFKNKYIGVCFNAKRNVFRAYIHKDNRCIHIGYFKNEVDAAKARDISAIELFGEFAKLNF